MKGFSVKDITVMPEEIVSKTRMILRDKRTDECTLTEIYHVGDRYPLQAMGHRIESYGYEIVSCETEKSLKGKIPWDQIYKLFEQKEKEYD